MGIRILSLSIQFIRVVTLLEFKVRYQYPGKHMIPFPGQKYHSMLLTWTLNVMMWLGTGQWPRTQKWTAMRQPWWILMDLSKPLDLDKNFFLVRINNINRQNIQSCFVFFTVTLINYYVKKELSQSYTHRRELWGICNVMQVSKPFLYSTFHRSKTTKCFTIKTGMNKNTED